MLADDPQLTARDPHGDPLPRQPLRVVVDSHCRTPPTARILQQPGTTLIATTQQSPQRCIDQLGASGAEVVTLPTGRDGRVSMEALLVELDRRDVVSLLVEGGGALLWIVV